jgi:hypothetical protein
MKNTISIILIGLLLSSCFKEEDPITPNPAGPIEEEVIPLTQYYENQVYFSLPEGKQVSINGKMDFDLSFGSHDTSCMIRLNSAAFMTAALTGATALEDVSDTTGLNWKFDKSDGNPDSTAFHGWINIDGFDTTYHERVWVLNLGINELGFARGLKKLILHRLEGDTYRFTYSNMDNSGKETISIQKNPGHNYTQFTFKDNVMGQVEPVTENWDLLFTQYTTLLYTDEGDPYPYLVTGTLINEYRTAVAFDSTMTFEDVILDDVLFLDYSKDVDAIGWDWKELIGDINGGDFYYTAHSHYNYFIRSQDGIFYKLRFIGFYDKETGEKGYPTFEFQRL